jgi:hypothetical protein
VRLACAQIRNLDQPFVLESTSLADSFRPHIHILWQVKRKLDYYFIAKTQRNMILLIPHPPDYFIAENLELPATKESPRPIDANHDPRETTTVTLRAKKKRRSVVVYSSVSDERMCWSDPQQSLLKTQSQQDNYNFCLSEARCRTGYESCECLSFIRTISNPRQPSLSCLKCRNWLRVWRYPICSKNR